MIETNPSSQLIIFLNYNGVLHPNAVLIFGGNPVFQTPYHQEFKICEWAPILESILDDIDPQGQIAIVLTTYWAFTLGCDKAKGYLPQSLRNRVIGTSDGSLEQYSLMNGFRLIEDYLAKFPCKDWISIDDDSYGWPQEFRDCLVLTEGAIGINSLKAQLELRIKLLERMNQVSKS